MARISKITVEHVVVESDRSYEQVKAALEARLSLIGDTDELAQQFVATKASWEQITQTIEKRMGVSGFGIFSKVEQGQLLSLAGKPMRVSQYAIGNPLLAIRMIEHVPEVALYAPLRLALYEGEPGRAFVAYDRFFSLLSQYHRAEVLAVARVVEQKLDELVAEATGTKGSSAQAVE